MASVQANGITVEYEIQGDGEPLLLVMGLGGQLTDWPSEFVDLLVAAGFQVITFDNRDQGLSTEFEWEPPTQLRSMLSALFKRTPKAGYLLTDMAADAVGLLDALDIQRAHLVGMSMGGMIAQTVAIEHPQRVLSLTSIMSHTGDGKNGRIAPSILPKLAKFKTPTREDAAMRSVEMFSLFSGPHYDPAEHLLRSRRSVERAFRPIGTQRQTAAIMASPDRTAALSRLDVPTLVVHGLMDKLVRPSGGTATAAAIPGSRLLMFPDMGHDLPTTRHQEIVDAIRRNADRQSTKMWPTGTALRT